eukprot:scaffold107886_cov63-Phaeocystis_antarctica.AAC.2
MERPESDGRLRPRVESYGDEGLLPSLAPVCEGPRVSGGGFHMYLVSLTGYPLNFSIKSSSITTRLELSSSNLSSMRTTSTSCRCSAICSRSASSSSPGLLSGVRSLAAFSSRCRCRRTASPQATASMASSLMFGQSLSSTVSMASARSFSASGSGSNLKKVICSVVLLPVCLPSCSISGSHFAHAATYASSRSASTPAVAPDVARGATRPCDDEHGHRGERRRVLVVQTVAHPLQGCWATADDDQQLGRLDAVARHVIRRKALGVLLRPVDDDEVRVGGVEIHLERVGRLNRCGTVAVHLAIHVRLVGQLLTHPPGGDHGDVGRLSVAELGAISLRVSRDLSSLVRALAAAEDPSICLTGHIGQPLAQHQVRLGRLASFRVRLGRRRAKGPTEGGFSARIAHGGTSRHVSTSRLTTTSSAESGARCTNLAGIARAGKRIEPKAAGSLEAIERRSIDSGGAFLFVGSVAPSTELVGAFDFAAPIGPRGDPVLTGAGRRAWSVACIVFRSGCPWSRPRVSLSIYLGLSIYRCVPDCRSMRSERVSPSGIETCNRLVTRAVTCGQADNRARSTYMYTSQP